MAQVQLRLPEKTIAEIDCWVSEGKFKSRSDAIRTIISLYEEREKTRRFYDLLHKRSQEAKKHPKKLVPLSRRAILTTMSERMLLPILITKEGKWVVASCPILDIATQGETEKEVKENMAELINEYLSDPDTAKPSLDDLMSLSLTNIQVEIPESVIHGKASTSTSEK